MSFAIVLSTDRELREKVLGLIIEIMETSFAYVKSDVICELLVQMAHMVNKNYEKDMEND